MECNIFEHKDKKKWHRTTISKYLLYKKFGFKKGLAQKLNSKFDPDNNIYGIDDCPDNIKWRQKTYGKNEYPL